MFLSFMITIGIPVIIVEYLGMSDQRLGITQGLLAVGGILGGLLTVIFEKKLSPQKSSFFLFLCSAFSLLMGLGMRLQHVPFLAYLFLSLTSVAVTISSTMFSIQMLAIVQRETPEHFIGKVIACIMTIIMCAQPVGQLLYGVLFEQFDEHIPLIMISASIVSFCIALYARKVFIMLGKEK